MTNTTVNINLWKGICEGDRKALESLYKKLYLDLYNYGIHVTPDIELVKDAINDMFLELWSNRKKLSDVSNVKSYLFTYLRRKLYASFKEIKKSDLIIQTFCKYSSLNESSFEDKIMENETDRESERRMFLVISKLTTRQKELVQLRYFSNLSVEEIAKKTGISTKTVYNTICNALRIMETKLVLLLLILFHK